jgi:hypothetical protein
MPLSAIDRQWNMMVQFCDITNINNLPSLEFDFSRNCVFSEGIANGTWDADESEPNLI